MWHDAPMREDWAEKYRLPEHESGGFWEKHWILSLLLGGLLVLLIWAVAAAAVVLFLIWALGWQTLAAFAFLAGMYFFFWLLTYGALRLLRDIFEFLRG